MKRRLLTIALAAMLSLGAFGGVMASDGAGSGAGQPSENANCLGHERAERNSAGGDREKGGFGPGQADYVKQVQPYGQWLQDWKADC